MKKTGCTCEIMTSTALEFPVLGPEAGGLLTVTLTSWHCWGCAEPLVKPFCVAAASAAVTATAAAAHEQSVGARNCGSVRS